MAVRIAMTHDIVRTASPVDGPGWMMEDDDCRCNRGLDRDDGVFSTFT
jgi:hypothetical protein